jgi:hypothetical protein
MAEKGRTVKCGKKKCESEAVNTLRFTDFIHEHVDVEYPVVLCEEHTKEVHGFNTADVVAVKKWLEAD